MQTEIHFSPSFAVALVRLAPGEVVRSEAGAMVSMTDAVEIKTDTQGGIMRGLKRSVLGGESFFMNTFTATGPGAEVSFAPALPGDIVEWTLAGQTVYLQSGSFLASSDGIDIDSKWGGAKTFFSREGLFMLKVQGTGNVLVSSYGAIQPIDLAPGADATPSTPGTWSAGPRGSPTRSRRSAAGSRRCSAARAWSCRLTGPGRIYLQTRSPESFLAWLVPEAADEELVTSTGRARR